MYEWYSKTWGEVVDELNSDEKKGLTFEKVRELKNNSNRNNGNKKDIKSKNLFITFLKQFVQLWSLMMILTAASLLITRNYFCDLIICVIYIITMYFVVSENYKKEKELKELEKIKPATIRVLRECRILRIPEEQLVIGDIVFLEKDEIVPQDLRLIESKDLMVKETAITGEVNAVEKYETKIDEKELSINEMTNILFRSSTIKEGSGTGIVIACGDDTQIEKTMRMVYEEKQDKVLFKKSINAMINKFNLFSLITLGILIFFLQVRGTAIKDTINFCSIILAASVPVEAMLIIVFTTSIIIGRLKNNGVFIKELWNLHILSKVKALCIDKVGLLTTENFNPEIIYTNNKSISIDSLIVNSNENISRLLNIAVICNNLKTIEEKNIIKICEQKGIIKKQVEKKQRRLIEIPFDSNRKIMTTLNKYEKNYRVNCKGDVDSIIKRCTHIIKDGVEDYLSQQDITNIKKKHIQLLISGKEAMAFAYRNFNYEPNLYENLESNLVFVGIMSFDNPVLKDAGENLETIKESGIKTVIITDESKLSAAYMQSKFGIEYDKDSVVAGVELANAEEDEFDRTVEKAEILSKITAAQRKKVVDTYKNLGFVTACTGSKLIHMPALKAADVGISIGTQSSLLVRKLSEIYVDSSGMTELVHVIKQGSNVINSIFKAIMYSFCCCIIYTISILAMMIVTKHFYVSPEKILITNIINSTIGAAAILNAYKENSDYKYSLYKIFVSSGIVAIISTLSLMIGIKYSDSYGKSLSLLLVSLNTVICIIILNGNRFFSSIISNMIVISSLLVQILIFIGFHHEYFNVTKWFLLFTIIEVFIMLLPNIIKNVKKEINEKIRKNKNENESGD